MDIFEQFESIDEQIESIKEKSDNNNEQLLSAGQNSGVVGGMGFGGTLYHNGPMTTGMIDGQFVNLYDNGANISGSIGGQQVSAYHNDATTTIY